MENFIKSSFKNITILIFSLIKPVSCLKKKVNISPPKKKPIVFGRKKKLSIFNEESYLARLKQSCEFNKKKWSFFFV